MGVIENYLDAKTAFEQISSEVNSLGTELQKIGTILVNNPGRFIFSNVQRGLPAEASMSRDSLSARGDQWKSADQIQEMLAKWHESRSALDNAWRAVPQSQQANLVPPNHLKDPATARNLQQGYGRGW